MTKLKLANKVRAYCKQSSTSLTDADLSLLLNDAKNEIAQRLADRDIKGNYFIVPTTMTLTAGVREYPLDATLLSHIYMIEVAFTATTDTFGQLQYILALPDDFRKWNDARTEASIQAHYSNAKGRLAYEIQRDGFYLLSGPIDSTTLGASSIASGIRVRYRKYPSDLGTTLTDDTTDLSLPLTSDANNMGLTFGMPIQLHELWARRAAIDWKTQHPGAVPTSALEQRYDTDLESAIQSLFENDLSGETIAIIENGDHNQDGYDL